MHVGSSIYEIPMEGASPDSHGFPGASPLQELLFLVLSLLLWHQRKWARGGDVCTLWGPIGQQRAGDSWRSGKNRQHWPPQLCPREEELSYNPLIGSVQQVFSFLYIWFLEVVTWCKMEIDLSVYLDTVCAILSLYLLTWWCLLKIALISIHKRKSLFLFTAACYPLCSASLTCVFT